MRKYLNKKRGATLKQQHEWQVRYFCAPLREKHEKGKYKYSQKNDGSRSGGAIKLLWRQYLSKKRRVKDNKKLQLLYSPELVA